MNAVMLLWQLFRFEKIEDLGRLFGIIFGTVRFENIFYTWQHYFDARTIVFAVIGIAGASLFGLPAIRARARRFSDTGVGAAIYQSALLILFLVSILFMVNSVYSPFLYFQY